MNALDQFYINLDHSNWDVKQENDINQTLQEVEHKLNEAGLSDILHLAEIERQTFNFSKSPEKSLSYRVSGTSTIEDGSQIPFEWPEIREFKKEDFDYLYKRFQETRNIYAKSEYGLVLFYSKTKQDNNFVIDLLKSLFDLLKTYIEKAKQNDLKNHYILYSTTVLNNALHIANNRKQEPAILAIFNVLIKYTFDTHQRWESIDRYTLPIFINFTNFAVQYFKDFKLTVELSRFILKNYEVAKVLSNSYVWGAIYIADISIKLSRKLDADINKWLYFKASQFEKLSEERKGDLASVSFVENAMTIYKGLNDDKNLRRLQQIYQQLRTDPFEPHSNFHRIPYLQYLHYLEIINGYSNLTKNWDSYDADEISQISINKAIKTLNHLYNKGLLSNKFTVNVFPMRDGGIQFEFDGENICVELEISPNGNATFILFDDDGNILKKMNVIELSEIPSLLKVEIHA